MRQMRGGRQFPGFFTPRLGAAMKWWRSGLQGILEPCTWSSQRDSGGSRIGTAYASNLTNDKSEVEP
jgi:hypothetical protein